MCARWFLYGIVAAALWPTSLLAAEEDWPDTASCALLKAAVGSGRVETMEEASFVIGNTLFTVYHELGHALVDMLELPVLGREEDAVDSLAAILMIPEEVDPCSDTMIMDAADGWLLSALRAERDDEPVDFFDEHGLDEQRFAATACLIAGSDPDGFADYADDLDMDADRVDFCSENYENTLNSWATLLEPILREDDEVAAKDEIALTIQDADSHTQDMEVLLRDSGVMDFALESFALNFKAPEGLSIVVEACADINAWYDPEDQKVTLCYELIDEFRDLFHIAVGDE